MKKLDYLVVRQFIGPFFVTLVITLFILLMQFLWVYIDELIGKGLEFYIIVKLLFFATARLVPLALPLAVLLSSIMTYGNLGEHYELVAMKASGVSLFRFMRALLVTVVFITIGAFIFSNHLLPSANMKFAALLNDVRHQKPALNIKEGTFYNEIEGFSIKVTEKGDDNRTIKDIIIYDHTSGKGNDNVLIAESGEMVMSDDGRYLILKMYNGKRYQDSKPMDMKGTNASPNNMYEHYSTYFETWEKWFDLSTFQFEEKEDRNWKDHYKMMNLSQLDASADTIRLEIEDRKKEFHGNIRPYFSFAQIDLDTMPPLTVSDTLYDSLYAALQPLTEPDKEALAYNRALGAARNVKSFAGVSDRFLEYRKKTLRSHRIEWHRKFTLSFACFVMFLIGAPLGAIIRVGGFGWPLFLSVVLFVVFHVLNMIGEKTAEGGGIDPLLGMWFSSAILLPGGIYITIQAMNDAPLFSLEWLYWIKRKLTKADKA